MDNNKEKINVALTGEELIYLRDVLSAQESTRAALTVEEGYKNIRLITEINQMLNKVQKAQN